MNRQFRKWITAAFAVCMLFAVTLPAALADGGSLSIRTSKDPNDDSDKVEYYAAPTAQPGAECKLYIPLECTGTVTNVSCEAVQSAFPAGLTPTSGFVASAVGGDTSPTPSLTDQKAYFFLSVTVGSNPVAASFTVPMAVNYTVDGTPAAPLSVSVDVQVQAPATPVPSPSASPSVSPSATPEVVEEVITYDVGSSGGSSGGGSGYRTKPKVIVSAYSFDAEKLYAGEQVALSLQLRNTSTREAVRNLELKFSNEAGVVMPVSGGSNSIYIGELTKNTSATIRIPLTIAPDAEAKAQSLALEIVYEGTKNKQEFTEKSTITVPIYQRARVRFDQPQIYDEAWAGQSVSMSVQMFNMGKSTLYNCMVEVQGEGLSLEETYYGGNVASGSTMRADLTVLTATAGTIEGTVRITYEDVFGEQSEELLPFTLAVNEEAPMMMEPEPGMAAMADDPGTSPGNLAGLLRYWWIALIVLLAVAPVIMVALHKRRRARLLAEDMPQEDEDDTEFMQPDAPDENGGPGNEA